MAFDLHISIPDDSPAIEAVQRVAATERITPDQAAARLLEEAARRHDESPPLEIWGAFSNPEDAKILDQAMSHIEEFRAKFDQPNPAQRMIGLFSSPEDAALMDEVMALARESREAHTTRDIGL